MPEVRLIDANALMKRVCEKECGPHFNIDLCDLDDDSTDTRCVFREYVRLEPTVEAEPVRHGRWIEDHTDLICSVCKWKYSDELPFMSNHGLDSMTESFARCPHCGAKMYQTGGTISKEQFAEIVGDDNG